MAGLGSGSSKMAHSIVVGTEPAAISNVAPTVVVDEDSSIIFGATVSLSAVVEDDGLPVSAEVTTTWTQTAGPGTAVFNPTTGLTTEVSFDVAGAYTLRATADDTALSGFDEVVVTMGAAPTVEQTIVASGVSASQWTQGNQTVTLPSGIADDDVLTVGCSAYVYNTDGVQQFTGADHAEVTSHGLVRDGGWFGGIPNNWEGFEAFSCRLLAAASGTDLTMDFTSTITNGPRRLFQWAIVRGVPTTGAIVEVVSVDDGTSSSGSEVVAASIARVTEGGLLCFATIHATTAITFTPPDGMTKLVEDSGTALATFMGWEPPAPAAASGSRTITYAPTYSSHNLGILVGLQGGSGTIENTAPTVDVGANQSVGSSDSVACVASVDDDGLPTSPGVTTVLWTKTSGPGTATFVADTSVSTTCSFDADGTYVLRCTADDSLLTGFDEFTVNVGDLGSVSTHAFDNGWLVTDIADVSSLYIPGAGSSSSWVNVAASMELYSDSLYPSDDAKRFNSVGGFANKEVTNPENNWNATATVARGYFQATTDPAGPILGSKLLLAIPLLVISNASPKSRSSAPFNLTQLVVELQDPTSFVYQMFYDMGTYMIDAANVLGANPSTWCALRVAHELNGDWYASNPAWEHWDDALDGDLTVRTAAFLEAFRLVVGIINDRVEGVLGAGSRPQIVWNYAGGEGGGSGIISQSTKNLFPGNDIVDIISVDIYNWYQSRSNTDFFTTQLVLDACAEFAEEQQLPVAIDETGPAVKVTSTGDYNNSTKDDNSVFPNGIADWVETIITGTVYPDIPGISHVLWFQTGLNSNGRGVSHYFLDANRGIFQLPSTTSWNASPYPTGDTDVRVDFFSDFRAGVIARFGT